MITRPHGRYEVVRANWLWYRLERVSNVEGSFRDLLRIYFRLKKAEAHAKGLAENTWTLQGPIMSSFVQDTPPQEEPHVRSDDTVTIPAVSP